MEKNGGTFPLGFDAFFDAPFEQQVCPEGIIRCACKLCLSYGSPCLTRVEVPGDVCDTCIEDCFKGQRDITL